MTTIVNTPGNNDSGSGMGMIVGVIILLIVVVLLFFYGLPLLRQSSAPSTDTPVINVPDQVDINVNQPKP